MRYIRYGTTYQKSQSAVFMLPKKGVPSAVVGAVHNWCQDYAAGLEESSTGKVLRLQKFCVHNCWVFMAPRKSKTTDDCRERRMLSDTRRPSREAPAQTVTGEPGMPFWTWRTLGWVANGVGKVVCSIASCESSSRFSYFLVWIPLTMVECAVKWVQFEFLAALDYTEHPVVCATAQFLEGYTHVCWCHVWLFMFRCLLRYGCSLADESCMSVRFSYTGDRLLALRRRLPPVLYRLDSTACHVQFHHAGYHNSCTMKSCSFAGSRDEVGYVS